MNFAGNPERERVLDQVLDARSLTEIRAAEQELRSWLKNNPKDTGIREAFEGLSLMRDIAEEQEAERMSAERQTVPLGKRPQSVRGMAEGHHA